MVNLDDLPAEGDFVPDAPEPEVEGPLDALGRPNTGSQKGHPGNPNFNLAPDSPIYQKRMHFEAFEVWYDNDRDTQLTAKMLHRSGDTIRRWVRTFDWHRKADRRDAKMQQKIEQQGVAARERMFNRQIAIAQALQAKGYEFITTQPVLKTSDAVQMIRQGVDIERTAMGLPTQLMEISAKSDSELIREFTEVSQQLVGTVIDVRPKALGPAEGGTEEEGGEL